VGDVEGVKSVFRIGRRGMERFKRRILRLRRGHFGTAG